MRDYELPEQDDWRIKADEEDEQRPANREQHNLLVNGRDNGDENVKFHPLAPTELQQRRLRRAQGRSEAQSGDEAA